MFEQLKEYMQKFSSVELKEYLGKDIVDSLLEWTHSEESVFTKRNLSEMIIAIHQSSILKDPKFRKSLASKFSKEDILEFRQYLTTDFKNSEDLEIIVEEIANKKWGNNAISKLFLSKIGLNESIFITENQDIIEKVSLSAGEKFYELLDYQYVIRQRVLTELTSGIELNRMLVQMPTGTGKTKTASHIISHHYCFNIEKNGLILWLAHATELLQQAYDTFSNVWKHIGIGEINLYKFWGQYNLQKDEEFNGFMACGIQKMQSIKKSNPKLFEKLVNNCRLVVFDEAHKASAPETQRLIEDLMTKKDTMPDRALVGLTATPGRSTAESTENHLLASMFRGNLIAIDTDLINRIGKTKIQALNNKADSDIIKYLQDRKVLAQIVKEKLEYNIKFTAEELKNIKTHLTSNGYDDFTQNALEIIGRNKNRNLKILERLKILNHEKVPTIVFACSVKHAVLLSSFLSLDQIPNAVIIGEMPQRDREIAIKKFKDKNDSTKILINYEVLTTGFDSTNIRCVFITRPTQSVVLYSQMLGRGLRGPQMGGNPKCLLIDIEDNLKKYDESLAFKHFSNYWE